MRFWRTPSPPRAEARTPLPLGLERAPVIVLEPERVVLCRVAVRDLEHPSALLPHVPDPVRFLSRHDELVTGMGFDHTVPDLDHQAGVEDDPHLVSELVIVFARLLGGLDRDDPDRRGLVQGVRGDLPPRLLHDQGSLSFFSLPASTWSKTLAICMAAMAASQPLLPCLPPARSRACSSVSVVRTPKATGTPVSRATCWMPHAACPATRSK